MILAVTTSPPRTSRQPCTPENRAGTFIAWGKRERERSKLDVAARSARLHDLAGAGGCRARGRSRICTARCTSHAVQTVPRTPHPGSVSQIPKSLSHLVGFGGPLVWKHHPSCRTRGFCLIGAALLPSRARTSRAIPIWVLCAHASTGSASGIATALPALVRSKRNQSNEVIKIKRRPGSGPTARQGQISLTHLPARLPRDRAIADVSMSLPGYGTF